MSTHNTNKDDESTLFDENKKIKSEEYIKQLSDIEKEALEIAKRQLESSFDIEKSIGFIQFIE